ARGASLYPDIAGRNSAVPPCGDTQRDVVAAATAGSWCTAGPASPRRRRRRTAARYQTAPAASKPRAYQRTTWLEAGPIMNTMTAIEKITQVTASGTSHRPRLKEPGGASGIVPRRLAMRTATQVEP